MVSRLGGTQDLTYPGRIALPAVAPDAKALSQILGAWGDLGKTVQDFGVVVGGAKRDEKEKVNRLKEIYAGGKWGEKLPEVEALITSGKVRWTQYGETTDQAARVFANVLTGGKEGDPPDDAYDGTFYAVAYKDLGRLFADQKKAMDKKGDDELQSGMKYGSQIASTPEQLAGLKSDAYINFPNKTPEEIIEITVMPRLHHLAKTGAPAHTFDSFVPLAEEFFNTEIAELRQTAINKMVENEGAESLKEGDRLGDLAYDTFYTEPEDPRDSYANAEIGRGIHKLYSDHIDRRSEAGVDIRLLTEEVANSALDLYESTKDPKIYMMLSDLIKVLDDKDEDGPSSSRYIKEVQGKIEEIQVSEDQKADKLAKKQKEDAINKFLTRAAVVLSGGLVGKEGAAVRRKLYREGAAIDPSIPALLTSLVDNWTKATTIADNPEVVADLTNRIYLDPGAHWWEAISGHLGVSITTETARSLMELVEKAKSRVYRDPVVRAHHKRMMGFIAPPTGLFDKFDQSNIKKSKDSLLAATQFWAILNSTKGNIGDFQAAAKKVADEQIKIYTQDTEGAVPEAPVAEDTAAGSTVRKIAEASADTNQAAGTSVQPTRSDQGLPAHRLETLNSIVIEYNESLESGGGSGYLADIRDDRGWTDSQLQEYVVELADTALKEEEEFLELYKAWAKKYNIDSNPYDPDHHYDYWAAYLAGARPDPKTGHWPSKYKRPSHDNRYVAGADTIAGLPAYPTKMLSIQRKPGK